jgi:hypothetical protein
VKSWDVITVGTPNVPGELAKPGEALDPEIVPAELVLVNAYPLPVNVALQS